MGFFKKKLILFKNENLTERRKITTRLVRQYTKKKTPMPDFTHCTTVPFKKRIH